MNTAVVTCTNKDNSQFFYLLWTTNLKYTVSLIQVEQFAAVVIREQAALW